MKILVDSELLIELRDAANEAANLAVRQYRIDHFKFLVAGADELLAQPAQQQGAVVGWYQPDDPFHITANPNICANWHREGLRVAAVFAHPAPADTRLVAALETIYDEDYQAPHDASDSDIKASMKQCIFRIRRIVKEALAAHKGEST